MNLKSRKRVSREEVFACAFLTLAVTALAYGTWRFFSDTTFSFKHSDQPMFSRLLDGVLVTSYKDTILRPVAVIVDNSADGIPFQGLFEADLVYETIAEGNITRLLAFYNPYTLPDSVGPVRSVRPYFVSWASEVNAVLIHVGGSPDGLKAVEDTDHVNEFYSGEFFFRDQKRDAPHNIFTSDESITDALFANHFAPTTTFPTWSYTHAYDTTGSVTALDVNFSIPQYRVRWEYDGKERAYHRIRAGEKEDIYAYTIIVMAVQAKVLDRELRRSLSLVGEGRAWVFTRGGVQIGKWIKGGESERTQFVDASGNPLMLTPGVTWVEVIDDEGRLTF